MPRRWEYGEKKWDDYLIIEEKKKGKKEKVGGQSSRTFVQAKKR